VLDEATETLKTHQKVSANVNGGDAIGTVRYNLRLSQRWSNAVVKYPRHGRVRNEI